MAAPRRICVITGSRADYGHLQPVMRAIVADKDLKLQVIACGQHMDARFGETWKVIAADGFAVDSKVDIHLADDTALSTAEATGRAVSGIALALSKLKPDIVLVLGDRYEIFAASTAAMLLKIPIAHIHGGEVTEAAFDDAMRHSISKMAALHFVAAEPYRQRLIQMGENPGMVLTTGAPGLDQIEAIPQMTDEEIAADLKLAVTKPLFLITYHPVTLADDSGVAALDSLLRALSAFPDASMVFTGVNSDPGYATLSARIVAFVAASPRRRVAVTSLGQRRYIGIMRASDAVIGNSSSGLIEAPTLTIPTVNIGDRQKGRLRASSVIDCREDENEIRRAINQALDFDFRISKVAGQQVKYLAGGAAAAIVGTLKGVPLPELRTKRFHDIIPAP